MVEAPSKMIGLIIFLVVLFIFEVDAGMLCSFCESAIDELEEYLNREEKEVENWVDQFCDKVPIAGSICKDFLNQNIESLIDQIESNHTSEQICEELALC
ncbi:unnamed protein product [Caenorhabditis angaria]|uniref:Saposin B-type domain-containing protein n=1 Tax=Caenorhabditis angaria TaxID=860376 RepID=A0A9P1I8J0_9PELO|nr:unnamed protein product [Caenorhabditis angaria]